MSGMSGGTASSVSRKPIPDSQSSARMVQKRGGDDSGCIVIWSSLFAIGNLLYARWAYAVELLLMFLVSGSVLLYVINHLWDKAPVADTSKPVEQYA